MVVSVAVGMVVTGRVVNVGNCGCRKDECGFKCGKRFKKII